jgi:hypothetical protein
MNTAEKRIEDGPMTTAHLKRLTIAAIHKITAAHLKAHPIEQQRSY